MRIARLLAPAGITAALACGSPSPELEPGPDTGYSAELDGVQLIVNNHHWLDMVVRIQRDGQLVRIGQVPGSGRAVIPLPPRLLGSEGYVRILGHPIGSNETAVSDWISVRRGQTIEWTVESQTSRTSLLLY
jgi:hypothetical protein